MYCHNAFTSTAELRTALVEYDANATTATMMYDAIADWDVSAITSMNGLFKELTNINVDISDWNTSGVTDMSNMFGVRPDSSEAACTLLLPPPAHDRWPASRTQPRSSIP